jgi:hypothetical protein
VIRSGREWVPAVLRYNLIPNRVLVEIANLANEEDRALVATRRFRQEVAAALAEGLVEFFGGDLEPVAPPPAVAAAVTSREAPEVYGPADFVGPWPSPAAAKPSSGKKPAAKKPVTKPKPKRPAPRG